MEQKQQESITSLPNPANNDNIQIPPHGRQKKKRSFIQVLKVAIFTIRHRSSKSKAPPVAIDSSTGTWGKIVSSVRPLHLQTTESPPPATLNAQPHHDDNHAGMESSGSALGSPNLDECSNYASAIGLSDLLEDEGEESNKEEMFCDDEGDEMIDAKAEDFIAQFYEQMRMQRVDSMDRRHMRSLG